MEADVIVPVPLHRQRARERGFNQVDIFVRPLARSLRLPYRPVLLVSSRPLPEMHLLRYDERWEAVRGAFAMREDGRVDNLRILLLDDVMTTEGRRTRVHVHCAERVQSWFWACR